MVSGQDILGVDLLQRSFQRHHVVFQFALEEPLTAADVDVRLAIEDAHADVDHAVAAGAFNVAFEIFGVGIFRGDLLEVTIGVTASADAGLPAVAPVTGAPVGRRPVEVIVLVIRIVRSVGRPHKGSFIVGAPIQVARSQNFALVDPVDHVLSGVDMVSVHSVATRGRIVVVGGIQIELIGVGRPHVGLGVCGEDALDDGVIRLNIRLVALAGLDRAGHGDIVHIDVVDVNPSVAVVADSGSHDVGHIDGVHASSHVNEHRRGAIFVQIDLFVGAVVGFHSDSILLGSSDRAIVTDDHLDDTGGLSLDGVLDMRDVREVGFDRAEGSGIGKTADLLAAGAGRVLDDVRARENSVLSLIAGIVVLALRQQNSHHALSSVYREHNRLGLVALFADGVSVEALFQIVDLAALFGGLAGFAVQRGHSDVRVVRSHAEGGVVVLQTLGQGFHRQGDATEVVLTRSKHDVEILYARVVRLNVSALNIFTGGAPATRTLSQCQCTDGHRILKAGAGGSDTQVKSQTIIRIVITYRVVDGVRTPRRPTG